MTVAGGPSVVAIGGGHGLAHTLRAARRYAGELTAVVSVADDGGSSGRLRDALGIPAPGDLRRCLGALAPDDSVLAGVLEQRFAAGELAGHAFGNLLIAAFAEQRGDFAAGVEAAGAALGAVGRVLPATSGPVRLRATSATGDLVGQAKITRSPSIAAVSLEPPDAASPPAVAAAIAGADQIVLGPGSLYTSVLAACVVPAVHQALAEAAGEVVYVANLREQVPETRGYDVERHVAALLAHGVRPQTVLADPDGLELGELDATVRLVLAPVGRDGLESHDEARLAVALAALAPAGACGVRGR